MHRITRDKVEAAIWERTGKKGRFFQVSFSRPYQTADGSIGSSRGFGLGQCGDVVLAAVEAALWMEAQRQPRERSRNGDYSRRGNRAGVSAATPTATRRTTNHRAGGAAAGLHLKQGT